MSKQNQNPCEILIRDCLLCLDNEQEFYKRSMALRINFERKHRKGIFEKLAAIPALARTIKDYTATERVSSYYKATISKGELLEIASQMLEGWAAEWELGNYHLNGYLKSEAMPLIKAKNPKFFSRDAMKFFNCTMKDVSINMEQRELSCVVRNIDYRTGEKLSEHTAVYRIGHDWELDYKECREA